METHETLKILEKAKKAYRKILLEHEAKRLRKVFRNLPLRRVNAVVNIPFNTSKMFEKTSSIKELNLNSVMFYERKK